MGFLDLIQGLINSYNPSGQSDYDIAYANQPTSSRQTPSGQAGKQKEKTSRPTGSSGTFADFLSASGKTPGPEEEQPSYTPVQQTAPSTEESEQESKAFKKASGSEQKKSEDKPSWTDYWSPGEDTQLDLFTEFLNNGAGYESFGGGGKIPEKTAGTNIFGIDPKLLMRRMPAFFENLDPSVAEENNAKLESGWLSADHLVDMARGLVDPGSENPDQEIKDYAYKLARENANNMTGGRPFDSVVQNKRRQIDEILGNSEPWENPDIEQEPQKVSWKPSETRHGWRNGTDILRNTMLDMGYSDDEISEFLDQAAGSEAMKWYLQEYSDALDELNYGGGNPGDSSLFKTVDALTGSELNEAKKNTASAGAESAIADKIYNAASSVIPKIIQGQGSALGPDSSTEGYGDQELLKKLDDINRQIEEIRPYEDQGRVLTKQQRDQIAKLEEEYAETKALYDGTRSSIDKSDERLDKLDGSVEANIYKALGLSRSVLDKQFEPGDKDKEAAGTPGSANSETVGVGTASSDAKEASDQLKEFNDWVKSDAANEFFEKYGDLDKDDPLLFSKLRILANENIWKDLYGYGDIQGVDGWRDYLWGDDINPDDEDAWDRFWDAISNIRALRRSDIYGEDAGAYARQGIGNVATNLFAFAQTEEGRRLLGNLFDSEGMLKYLTSDPSIGGAGMSKADSNDLIAWGMLSRLSHGGYEGYSYDQLKDLANTFLELSGDEMMFGGPDEEGFERQDWRSNRHEGPYSWTDLSAGSQKLNPYDSGNILDWNALDTWQAYLDEAARREGLSPDQVVYLGRRS